jgi:hypothetical protein
VQHIYVASCALANLTQTMRAFVDGERCVAFGGGFESLEAQRRGCTLLHAVTKSGVAVLPVACARATCAIPRRP